MRTIQAEAITTAVRDACIEACCCLPTDVLHALAKAKENEKGHARAVLEQILENATLAQSAMRPCCQDTGMAVVFVDLGQNAHIEGNFNAAVNKGVSAGYREGYLRKSVVSALARENTGDNTPAILHLRLVEGDDLVITVAPKGFGSENMSRIYMLTPAQGEEGVLEAVVGTAVSAGACACPPGVIGVGIGGTMEAAALLAKRQLLRPLGLPSPDEELRRLEAESLRRINESGIGPMGLGGRVTALAVHMAQMPTHIAGLPVAINMQCHACRHATRRL
ncbi:MAG: fumarate hydratase [Candidatus Pelethousia sp.]|nr:fumarate hydratase [Candidatus Pelethousia sp.]